MPERGPVQLLLHFLRLRQASGWKMGLAIALVATLGLLPGEESLYHKARTGLAQSLRQAAWKHALAGEPQAKPWPWDQASPVVDSVVPRLGLSAAIHCDSTVKVPERVPQPSRKSAGIDAGDPHLASSDAGFEKNTEGVGVIGAEAFDEQRNDDRLWEPGAPPSAAIPSADCSPLDSSIPGALNLMIEAIRGNEAAPAEIERKL